MNAAKNWAVGIFTPTGEILYDVVVPALIMGAGAVIMAISGMLSENAAWWCFVIGILIHVLLLRFAGFLRQGEKKDGRHHGNSESEHG